MTRPTAVQLAEARASGRIAVAGAHTVGAPDGGPGVPGTGWSRQHGDLRVAHFLGLHAMQALPLLAVAVRRRHLAAARSSRLVVSAAASYTLLFLLLLWQALRGQSIVDPDGTTLLALAAWLVLTAATVRAAVTSGTDSSAAARWRTKGQHDSGHHLRCRQRHRVRCVGPARACPAASMGP
jgi:hypothetical protein